MTADLPPPTSRRVPVSAVLYPCTRTNLLRSDHTSGARRLHDEHSVDAAEAEHGSSLCAAARAMRPHAASAAGGAMPRLPESLAMQLASLQLWPADTTVALENGLEGPTAPLLQVCMLAAHAARAVDARCERAVA